MKRKLLGSAPTKESLLELIKDFYMGSDKTLNDDGTISNKDGSILSTKWELSKGRYRFISQ